MSDGLFKEFDEKSNYVLNWLTTEADAAPKSQDIEHIEKRFDALFDSFHKEKKKLFLYKPRQSK